MGLPNLPFWDKAETNNTAPPTSKENSGHKDGFPEAAQYVNHLFVLIWKWLRGLTGGYVDIIVGTSGEVTSKNATNTVADFVAALVNGDSVHFLAGTHTQAQNEDITEDDITITMDPEAIWDDGTDRTLTFSGERARVGPGRFTGFTAGDIILNKSGSEFHGIDVDLDIVIVSNGAQAFSTGVPAVPIGAIVTTGLVLSNDAGDADHDINVTAGKVMDSTNVWPMILTGEITKKIDVDWVAGNDQGGFPSALTLASGTWYHVFLIGKKFDPYDCDVGYDTSITAANLLADASAYDIYRRIGSVLTDGSSNIIPFLQDGDRFIWTTIVTDINTNSLSTSSVNLLTMTVPPDVRVVARFSVNMAVTVSAELFIGTPGQAINRIQRGDPTTIGSTGPHEILTDTNRQIRLYAEAADLDVIIDTEGWIDHHRSIG